MDHQSESDADSDSDPISAINHWLCEQALRDAAVSTLVTGCCKRLVAAGVPLWRCVVGFDVLHPLYESHGMVWRADAGIEAADHLHGSEEEQRWQQSPLNHLVVTDTPSLNRVLSGPDAQLDFPVLHELADAGATAYRAFMRPFREPGQGQALDDGLVGSWATRQPSGFTPSDLRALARIESRLALACKVAVREQTARNILEAYLGRGTGRRVLTGQIRRGDGEIIPAVILFSDLRQSTALAASLPLPTYLELLNRFLECIADAVQGHGGEVLRFIGDAALAIFPMSGFDSPAAACEAALSATRAAQAAVAAVNDQRHTQGEAPLAYGIGLHMGDVLYGNIGSRDRIEFTVIGPAANEAARIEGLCRTLLTPVVMSAAVATHAQCPVVSLGCHRLAGIDGTQEVFTLAPCRG